MIHSRAEYWQGLHDMVSITIHGSRYNYSTIQCNTMHIAMYCNIPHSSLKTAEIQVAVYDLGSVNTSYYIDNSVDKIESKQFNFKFPFQFIWRVEKLPNTLM